MPSAQTIEDAYGFGLITWREKTILEAINEYLWFPDSQAFPSLRTLSKKLGIGVRWIRMNLEALEQRIGFKFRRKRFRVKACLRRQTSNYFLMQPFFERLEELLTWHRQALPLQAEDPAVAPPASSAPLRPSALRSGHRSPTGSALEGKRNYETPPLNPTTQDNRNTTPAVPSQVLPVVTEEEIPGGEGGRDEDDPAALYAMARSWGLAGAILEQCRHRLGTAVAYVRHRLELAERHPRHVAPIPNPGAYLRTLLLDEDADLTPKVPPGIRKRDRELALLNPRGQSCSAEGFDAAQIKTSLMRLEVKLRTSKLGVAAPDVVDAVGRRLQELVGAIGETIDAEHVKVLETELEELDERTLQAALVRLEEETAAARTFAEKHLESFRRQMTPRSFENSIAAWTARELRRLAVLPRLSIYIEEA